MTPKNFTNGTGGSDGDGMGVEMTLVPCSKLPSLKVLPERCAAFYSDACQFREPLERWGGTIFTRYRALQIWCLDCPTGRKRARKSPQPERPNLPGTQFGNHNRPRKDLSPIWSQKFKNEQEWLRKVWPKFNKIQDLCDWIEKRGIDIHQSTLQTKLARAGIRKRKERF